MGREVGEGQAAAEVTEVKRRKPARAKKAVASASRKPAAGGKEAPVRRKYRPFSEEEVAALIQGVRRHGQGNWTKIHDDVDLPFMVRP